MGVLSASIVQMLRLVFFHKVISTVSCHSFDIDFKLVYSKLFTVNYVLLAFRVPKVLGCLFSKSAGDILRRRAVQDDSGKTIAAGLLRGAFRRTEPLGLKRVLPKHQAA